MKDLYNQDFIGSQKERLLKEKLHIEKELTQVAVYNEAEDKYVPKFEEFSPGETEDNEEAADEVTNYEENIAQARSLVRLLEEIKAALTKIEAGKYGYCENCNSYISEERLKAYPAAATCMKCEK